MTEGKLVASSTKGCYAVGSPNGPTLTSNQVISIKLDGQWIHGYVQHQGDIYVVGREVGHGYFFQSEDNLTRCGLCVGMVARLGTVEPLQGVSG